MGLQRMVREGSGPTVVLLHGLGANEADLFDLGELAPDDWRIVSFRAPFTYGDGFSWFRIDWDAAGLSIDVDGAKRAAADLAVEIAAYETPVLAGFSQGAMLTWLVLLSGAPLKAALMMSGAALEKGSPPAAVPTLVVHGRNDPVVPVASGRELGRLQGPLGRYVETTDGHGIGFEAQSAIRDWLMGIGSSLSLRN